MTSHSGECTNCQHQPAQRKVQLESPGLSLFQELAVFILHAVDITATQHNILDDIVTSESDIH